MMKTKRYRLLHALVGLFLILGLFGPVLPSSYGMVLKAQPVLVQMATSNPDQILSVIVQKTRGATDLEKRVYKLGGTVTKDLGIINAFAAEMSARAAMELAYSYQVHWVSLDAAMISTACTNCIDTSKLTNAYIRAIRADQVWNSSPYLQGTGIGVAVIDSGVNPNGDLYTNMGVNRQVADVRFNTDYNQNTSDGYGHGTHVASIVGGDGSESGGKYIGVAPLVNILNVKVSNDDGSAMMADVVAGLQWVLQNKDTYNIRVVNLSLNSSVAESYHTSPLNAAVEILWFNKIVVVVSAGNHGNGAIYPPANDPFVITVGATNDKGTSSISDDVMASFSAYGQTSDGVKKPDLVAPGTNIIARLVNQNMGLANAHPSNKIGDQYFRMSGTSMAAPMVSAAVALLLQDEPSLTPDQVKYRLLATANNAWPGYGAAKSGAGYLDVYAAVRGTTNQSANTGIKASQLLSTGSTPITWDSVGWNSVGWNTVGWNTVGWNTVGWNTVDWNSDYWGP
ncbi:MAG TPA: S8 family peptidase [Anaerolineales bacterium]|nr:S8 family peptidase [Anaerolineales bacterium]